MRVCFKLLPCLLFFLILTQASIIWSACSPCVSQCEEQWNKCQKICKDSCQKCRQNAAWTSTKAHARFVHEQAVQGGIIFRELPSYRDPLQCYKKTCSCKAEFAVCKQACEGLIKKYVMPEPRCC